jgi:sortase A
VATTVAPATTQAPTTVAPTTAAPTTSTIPLPIPAPVPDPGAVEPEIPLGTLEVPKIGLSTTMFEGVTLSTLDRGPGHWPGSAMAGQTGNMVVAGHRMSHDRPFEDLDLLAPGDEMIVTDATGRHVYRVVGTDIVQPEALWILDQTPAATATLFACHPKGSTKQRIVVHLELVP